jgi:hypothetical protein
MMNQPADDRVAVHFGPPAADEAVLIEGDASAAHGQPVARFCLSPALAGHAAGCACCVPRAPAAQAVGRLFLARARGEVAWFRSVAVLATPAGEAAVRAALAGDQVSSGRFRLTGPDRLDASWRSGGMVATMPMLRDRQKKER